MKHSNKLTSKEARRLAKLRKRCGQTNCEKKGLTLESALTTVIAAVVILFVVIVVVMLLDGAFPLVQALFMIFLGLTGIGMALALICGEKERNDWQMEQFRKIGVQMDERRSK